MDSLRDLRFLVPYKPHESVAVIGKAEELVLALQEESVDVTVFDQDSFRSDRTFDHLMIPSVTPQILKHLPEKISRLLRPQGRMLIAVGNKSALERHFLFRKKEIHPESSFRLGELKKLLRNANMSFINVYGLRDIHSPQHIVSMDQKAASRFYFKQMFYPHSFVSAGAQKLSGFLGWLGCQHVLFKYYCVIAEKKCEESDFHDRIPA